MSNVRRNPFSLRRYSFPARKGNGWWWRSIKLLTAIYSLQIIFSASSLFAFGKNEEVDDRPVNNGEWVLAITSFDVSSLPRSRRIIGDVILRELVNSLNIVNHRIRVSPEYAWYEGYAWAKSRSTAAKALAAKRDERDLLLFRGDPNWRYRRSLKTLDGDIEKLEAALKKAASQQPLVEAAPSFKLTEVNNTGTFPTPPVADGEYQFCKNQKVDAFLTGSVSEYHGRIYVSLRLYTIYTNSFVYEDSIIFSTDDTTAAVNEISGRLVAVLAGANSAEIAVHTSPGDALVLVNSSFAGRGGISRREYPPGKVKVEIFAENYETVEAETELISGELTEITVNLQPLNLVPMNISAPGKSGALVYQGALYVGEAPFTLQLPANQLEYVFAETPQGESSKVVFLVNEPIPPMGSPREPSPFANIFPKKTRIEGNNIRLQTRVPPPPDPKRVLKVRRQYYRAWAGTWFAGITTWMLYGLATNYSNAYNIGYDSRLSGGMYEDANRLQTAFMCGIGVVSAAVLVEAIQMARYIYTAGDDAPPVVK
jgi:hypothetical protein